MTKNHNKSKPKRKTPAFNCYLDAEDRLLLKQYSQALRVSQNDVIRMALQEYFERHKSILRKA